MNLFGYYDHSEDEGLTENQILKKRMRKRANRSDTDVNFKGKVNLSSKDLSHADEVWLVKVPRVVKPERFEGHDIQLDKNATNSLLQLNNGSVFEANVSKVKFKLPLVCPDSSKDRVSARVNHGVKAVAAYNQYVETVLARERGQDVEFEPFEDLEEKAEILAVPCKGTITINRHVEVGTLPDQKAEVIEKIAQPKLKRRHPFFGLDSPPQHIEKVQFESDQPTKMSKKRKKPSS